MLRGPQSDPLAARLGEAATRSNTLIGHYPAIIIRMPESAKDPFAVEYRHVPGKGLFAAGGLRFHTEEADLRRDYAAALERVAFPRLLGEAALWVLWPSTAAIWAFPFLLARLSVDYALLADAGLFLAVQIVTMLFYARPLNYALLVLGNRPLQAVIYIAWAVWFWRDGATGKVVALAAWFLLMAFGVAQVIFVTPFLPLLKVLFSRTPADQALHQVARRYAR